MSESSSELPAPLRAWRDQGRWFEHQGLRLFFRDQGTGPTLLCLHGFPTASWDWHALWPTLTRQYRVIAPDLLGFGFSSKPAHFRYSIDAQADFVTALLGSLEVREVHLLVHDYGTMIAQELLARQCNAVGSIEVLSACTLNASVFADLARPRPLQYALASPAGPLLTRLLTERLFCRGIRAVFGSKAPPSPALLSAMWSLVRENSGQHRMHELLSYLKERHQRAERWHGAWLATQVPRKLLSGGDDPVAGLHVVEAYRRRVPAADVTLLEGVGHYAMIEDPSSTLSAFSAFQRRVAVDGALQYSGEQHTS